MFLINLYPDVTLQSLVIILGIVGFCAAASIGTIAWYNSRRPIGWKDKQKPDYVPDIDAAD